MRNLLIRNRNLHRKSGHLIRPMHNIIFRRVSQFCESRAYIYLYQLSCALTHFNIMLSAHILLNISCKVITCNTNRIVRDNPSQRDNCNFSRPAANIHNHISFRCFHIKTDTDSSCHRLINHIHIATSCMLRRVTYSTYLYLCTSRRYAYHHSQRRSKPTAFRTHHFHHAPYHLLSSIEVGNHAIPQRTYSTNILMRLAMHLAGFLTHGQQFVGTLVKSHYRRLIHHHLAIMHDNSVGSTQIDSDLLCKRK